MSWFERMTDRIRSAQAQCIIDARESFGTPYLFHGLALSSPNTLWIEIDPGDDAIRIGNRLSTALLRSSGATFFGMGMPYQYGLSYLQRLTDELGPTTLLVSRAHHGTAFAHAALRHAAASDGRLRVVLSGASRDASWRRIASAAIVDVITEEDLRVSEVEATAMFSGLDENMGLLEDAYRLAAGAYEGLLAAVSSATGSTLPSRPAPDGVPAKGANDELGNGFLERLMASDRWQEAFEHAVRIESDLALGLITEAADSYFSNGEVMRFLQFLRQLNAKEPGHATVMYWDFLAHVSLGRLDEVEDRVGRYLRCNEAPELQAAFASAVRPPDALALAEDAVQKARSPETLAALGFLGVMHGDAAAGVSHLIEAFSGYKAARRYHKAIQLSNSIGSAYVTMGEYRRGVYWAQWSLDELRRRGIREELLRLSSINLLAFSYLLIGEVDAGEEQLRRITLDIDGPLPSTLEGLMSTFGDYEIVVGRPMSGLRYYERLVKHLGSRLPGFAVHNVVRGLVHAGRTDDAVAAARVAADVTDTDDEVERAHVRAATILATVAKGTYALDGFDDFLASPVVQADAVLMAELLICQGVALLRADRTAEAIQLLSKHRHVLAGLGHSAWTLFSPPQSDVDHLRGLMGLGDGGHVRLNFLGARTFRRAGQTQGMSSRFAELFAILALYPDGLSGEALLYEMYGEDGHLGTLKATVSRARKIVDIHSVPYRASQPLDADFIELEDCLGAGHLREALELYKGPLLPESEAPGIRRARERIDEAVRQAVLHSGEWDLALRLARKFPDDLELWEEAGRLAPKNDPAYPLIRAQVRRIRGEWGL